MGAHQAACAAGKQGKFVEFAHEFWKQGFGAYARTRDPAALGSDTIAKIVKQLGLDKAKLDADMKGACAEQIRKDMAELNKFGVNGTPSFFVNGKFSMFSGPAAFKKLIDDELVAVKSSGVPAGEYYQKVVMEKGLKKFRSKADANKAGTNKGG
jgi:protein-disulfide isomerase